MSFTRPGRPRPGKRDSSSTAERILRATSAAVSASSCRMNSTAWVRSVAAASVHLIKVDSQALYPVPNFFMANDAPCFGLVQAKAHLGSKPRLILQVLVQGILDDPGPATP